MIKFPEFSGIRCLMMPYIQGDPSSVPNAYASYSDIIRSVYARKGDIGFLTIDESPVVAGKPHRGARARYDRALHTEVGKGPCCGENAGWGSGGWGGGWGGKHLVHIEKGVRVLIASNLDDSCAVWDAEQEETSPDGDIGHLAWKYPYDTARFLKAGEVADIGILTPHESLPVKTDFNRQFIRIVSAGVHGREPYFTENPFVSCPC